tara:strand:- start:155 stop:502 length:348 start_codon:yes stop_codon:yes gene_type:complete
MGFHNFDKNILPSTEQAEDIIEKAFSKEQKIWTLELKNKTGYVFLVNEMWWRDTPIERNSDEWNLFHRYSPKDLQFRFKVNPGETKRKYFTITFCPDFDKRKDLLLVAIYNDETT